jgi:hypothetical protein
LRRVSAVAREGWEQSDWLEAPKPQRTTIHLTAKLIVTMLPKAERRATNATG